MKEMMNLMGLAGGPYAATSSTPDAATTSTRSKRSSRAGATRCNGNAVFFDDELCYVMGPFSVFRRVDVQTQGGSFVRCRA